MLATLPNECLFEIFKNLRFYNACLFSCLLVNRQLCRIIIPILWSKPKFNDKRFVLICLLTLNHEEQTQLIPFNIMLQNEPKPLFEYTSYITNFENENYNHLISGITSWLKSFKNGGNKEHELYGTMFRGFFRADRPTNAIICSLFTMFLRTSTRLKNLTFIGNIHNKIMFAETGKAIADALYVNSSLDSLNLNSNELDTEVGKAMAKALRKNTTLTNLNLDHNQLGFKGGMALAEALCENRTLGSLSIGDNDIIDRKKSTLSRIFWNNPFLQVTFYVL
ncbi:f-box domain-containing protein [Gigaspora margarita]|uniref:F-box domain-containing protein n=1 Tax=Gigaspora margarita TaxID=4874 RepID=A0A8H4A4G1_GIGMA|nr:f-box domain-containing protein [Gigaspora margarita]